MGFNLQEAYANAYIDLDKKRDAIKEHGQYTSPTTPVEEEDAGGKKTGATVDMTAFNRLTLTQEQWKTNSLKNNKEAVKDAKAAE